MSNKNCHSVLLFPPEGGFLAVHLSSEAGFDSKLRAYEDLNGKLKKTLFQVFTLLFLAIEGEESVRPWSWLVV